jgi:hypothetical protein
MWIKNNGDAKPTNHELKKITIQTKCNKKNNTACLDPSSSSSPVKPISLQKGKKGNHSQNPYKELFVNKFRVAILYKKIRV